MSKQRLAGKVVRFSDGENWRLDPISVALYGDERYECDAAPGFTACPRKGAYWAVMVDTELTLVVCRPHAKELVNGVS